MKALPEQGFSSPVDGETCSSDTESAYKAIASTSDARIPSAGVAGGGSMPPRAPRAAARRRPAGSGGSPPTRKPARTPERSEGDERRVPHTEGPHGR